MCTLIFVAALLAIAETRGHPGGPLEDECGCGTLMQWNITRQLNKKEILLFAATWMDVEDIILSETSQAEKDNWFHLYVESKKGKHNKNRLIHYLVLKKITKQDKWLLKNGSFS